MINIKSMELEWTVFKNSLLAVELLSSLCRHQKLVIIHTPCCEQFHAGIVFFLLNHIMSQKLSLQHEAAHKVNSLRIICPLTTAEKKTCILDVGENCLFKESRVEEQFLLLKENWRQCSSGMDSFHVLTSFPCWSSVVWPTCWWPPPNTEAESQRWASSTNSS